MAFGITVHTLVKNEEKFIKYALISVIDEVDKMLVWDTASTDETVSLIKSIKSDKVTFRQCGMADKEKIVRLRNEQLSLTKTPWFLVLDGDEIWPKNNLLKLVGAMKKAKKETIALVNKTRNCIGDIYHYLAEVKGKYHVGPWRGHLNIRAIRNLSGLEVKGKYPLEAYTYKSVPLQNLTSHLEFVDTWYLHTTHLKRSSWLSQLQTIDRLKKYKWWGKSYLLKEEEIPEVLSK